MGQDKDSYKSRSNVFMLWLTFVYEWKDTFEMSKTILNVLDVITFLSVDPKLPEIYLKWSIDSLGMSGAISPKKADSLISINTGWSRFFSIHSSLLYAHIYALNIKFHRCFGFWNLINISGVKVSFLISKKLLILFTNHGAFML